MRHWKMTPLDEIVLWLYRHAHLRARLWPSFLADQNSLEAEIAILDEGSTERSQSDG